MEAHECVHSYINPPFLLCKNQAPFTKGAIIVKNVPDGTPFILFSNFFILSSLIFLNIFLALHFVIFGKTYSIDYCLHSRFDDNGFEDGEVDDRLFVGRHNKEGVSVIVGMDRANCASKPVVGD